MSGTPSPAGLYTTLSPLSRSGSDTELLKEAGLSFSCVSTCIICRIQDFIELLCSTTRSGVSPEGRQEGAVVSEDVGNFLVCVEVVRVLFLKVADDVPLASLLGEKTHANVRDEEEGGGGNWREVTLDSHPKSGPPPGSATLSPGRPAAGG